jgi:hypothetical protein
VAGAGRRGLTIASSSSGKRNRVAAPLWQRKMMARRSGSVEQRQNEGKEGAFATSGSPTAANKLQQGIEGQWWLPDGREGLWCGGGGGRAEQEWVSGH